MTGKQLTLLVLVALAAGPAAGADGEDEPAIAITRVAEKAGGGAESLRLTLSATLAPTWGEANVGFLALRTSAGQSRVATTKAHGRELEVALPDGCGLLLADLGRPEDRGFADSWRRSRRSVKAVVCRGATDPAADRDARRRAAGLFMARGGTRDEVRPMANPATTQPGRDLPVRLYADGRLAAGAEVIAEGPGGAASFAVADAQGFAVVALPAAGPWRVYFHPAEDRVAELLFEVPEPWADGGAR